MIALLFVLYFDSIKCMKEIYLVLSRNYESWNNFKNSTLVKISHFHRAINS